MRRMFAIADHRRPVCQIVTGSVPDPQANHAAIVLSKTIKQITGKPARAVTQDSGQLSGNMIVIGEPTANGLVRKLLLASGVEMGRGGKITKLARKRNGDQGFVIRFVKQGKRNCAVLAGNTSQGTFYAAQTFANRIYRAKDKFGVDRRNEITTPAFQYRSVFTGLGGPDPLGPHALEHDFGRRNGSIDVGAFIHWLARYRINHLVVSLFNMDCGLAYPSKKYPHAVNKYHLNITHEFFHDLVKCAKKNYMKVWLVVEFPDRCLGLIRSCPELALKRSADAVLHNLTDEWWDCFFKGDVAYREFRILQASGGGLDVNNPATMRFWRTFWRELLATYPEVDGIGLELCEHLSFNPRGEDFYDRMWQYYASMVDIAEKVRPGLTYWMWHAPGGRQVAKRRDELPNLSYIHWGDGAERTPVGRAQGTKTDWYLTHGSTRLDYEPWIKRHCMQCERLGLKGMQKRMAIFRPLHNVYSAFDEFTWSPKTSWAEYAMHHVMRTHHVKDANRAKAYAEDLRSRSARLPRKEVTASPQAVA